MRHECRSAHVKTFRQSAVVRQVLTEHHHLPLLQPIFTNHQSVSAASPTGWNHHILRSFELFNLLAPFLKLLKCATARTSHAKVIVKTDTSIEVWFFSAKDVRWSFNRRPQRASWRIGASDPPPSTRVKTWDFTAKLQFPPSSKADEGGTPF